MTIEIRIEGSNAQGLAVIARSFLEEVFRQVPETHSPLAGPADPRKGDPVAVAALILAVPGAVLATLDLVQRARLAERIETLCTSLRNRATPGDRVQLLMSGSDTALDLLSANRDAVMNRLEAPSDNKTGN